MRNVRMAFYDFARMVARSVWLLVYGIANLIYHSARVILRVAFFLVFLAAAIAAAAAVMLKVMVTPDAMKAMAITQLQNVLHRPVQIDRVSVLIFEGIRLRGLKVLESTQFPGVLAGDALGAQFLSSDVVLAKYKWRALLRRRLELSEVRLVSPRIQIVRREDGTWNVADIFTSSSTRRAEVRPGGPALPFSLAADVVAIDHGTIAVRDIPRRRQYTFHDFNLKVWGFDPVAPFEAEAETENLDQIAGRQVRTRVAARGSVALAGFHWEEAGLSARKIGADIDGEFVSASGSVKNFLHPTVDLKARVPGLDAAYLARYSSKVPPDIAVPPTVWRIRLAVPTTDEWRLESADAAAGPLRLRLSGAARRAGPRWLWRLEATAPPAPLERFAALRGAWKRYAPSGTASAGASLSGAWGAGPAAGAPSPAASAPASAVRVDKAAVSVTGFEGALFRGRLQASNADFSLRTTDNLRNAVFDVSRGTAVAYGVRLSDLRLSLAVHKDDVALDRLNMTWDGSRLGLRGSVRNLSAPKEVRLDADVDRLDLDDAIDTGTRLVRQIKPPARTRAEPATPGPWSRIFKRSFPKKFPATAGHLRIAEVVHPNFQTRDLDVLWNLRGISTGLRKVTGDIQVSFGPGRASDIPTLQQSHKILNVIFLPFVFMHKLNSMTVISAATAYPKTLDFKQIAAWYGLRSGVVSINRFNVDSGQLMAWADGTVDFPKERVSLHVLTRLTESRGPLPEYLSDEKGRPCIGFFVEDDLNKPTLRIDFHKMEQDAIERNVERAVRRSRPIFGLEGG